MDWTRRDVVGGIAAFLALPGLAGATALDASLDEARLAMLARVRERALGFDVAAAVRHAMEQAGIARRYRDGVSAVLEPLGLTHGLHSVSDLLDLDGEPLSALRAIADRMRRSLGVKLAVRRTLKAAPRTPEARQSLLDRAVRDLFGLDMDELRAHVAQYPTEAMVIVFAPVTRLSELIGLILYEPFALYLQLAHGTRARIQFCDGDDALEQVVRAFVDPAVRRVALVGHGHWDSLSLDGYRIGPDAAFERLCTLAASDPKAFAGALDDRRLWKLLPGPYWRERLDEPELSKLAAQLYPHGDVPFKDLVVRYTCGTRRYTTDATLLWLLLPDAFDAQLHVASGAFSVRDPEQDDAWVSDVVDWFGDKQVNIEEASALGTSFVAAPQDTRGYAGLSWIDDFFADPVPDWLPPAAFEATAPVAVE